MGSVHKLLLAVLLGFLFTAFPGSAVIRFLKRMDFRQAERKEGPPSHLKKAGTPTMGGVFLLLGWLLAALLSVREGFALVLPVLLVTVLCSLMGFLFTAIPGPAVIRFLKRMNFRQTERKEAPR